MLPSSHEPEPRESLPEKLLRKGKEQPVVPLGVLCTCGALYLASRALRMRDARLANRMFFWRVGFQGITVAALVGGAFLAAERRTRPESRDSKLRKLAKEREKLWIEELERIEEDAAKVRARKAVALGEFDSVEAFERAERAAAAKSAAAAAAAAELDAPAQAPAPAEAAAEAAAEAPEAPAGRA